MDELRAAGALEVPVSWRKSLGVVERDLFSGLLDDSSDPHEHEDSEAEFDDSEAPESAA